MSLKLLVKPKGKKIEIQKLKYWTFKQANAYIFRRENYYYYADRVKYENLKLHGMSKSKQEADNEKPNNGDRTKTKQHH